jgi:hypothetical protein
VLSSESQVSIENIDLLPHHQDQARKNNQGRKNNHSRRFGSQSGGFGLLGNLRGPPLRPWCAPSLFFFFPPRSLHKFQLPSLCHPEPSWANISGSNPIYPARVTPETTKTKGTTIPGAPGRSRRASAEASSAAALVCPVALFSHPLRPLRGNLGLFCKRSPDPSKTFRLFNLFFIIVFII